MWCDWCNGKYLNKLKVIIKILKRILICVLFKFQSYLLLLWGDDILLGPFTMVSEGLPSLSLRGRNVEVKKIKNMVSPMHMK